MKLTKGQRVAVYAVGAVALLFALGALGLKTGKKSETPKAEARPRPDPDRRKGVLISKACMEAPLLPECQPPGANTGSGTPRPPPAPPPLEVTVKQIVEDYRANEIGADEKYRDKSLLVTGIVGGVARDDLDRPFVGLVANGFEKGLMKAIFANETGLGALKKSDVITIRCRGQNYDKPELVDCVLVSTK